MSLFDVIRYPINDCPTFEQVMDIPAPVFREWKEQSSWKTLSGINQQHYVANWFRSFHDVPIDTERLAKDINVLRRLISEHQA